MVGGAAAGAVATMAAMLTRTDHDRLSAVIFAVAIFEGLLPFAGRLFGFSPLLSLPLRIGSPWWWIVSTAVLLACAALLIVIDEDKRRQAGA